MSLITFLYLVAVDMSPERSPSSSLLQGLSSVINRDPDIGSERIRGDVSMESLNHMTYFLTIIISFQNWSTLFLTARVNTIEAP
jgi:hypothetical protein